MDKTRCVTPPLLGFTEDSDFEEGPRKPYEYETYEGESWVDGESLFGFGEPLQDTSETKEDLGRSPSRSGL